jgi:predicted amidophosphoribosyltransferase
VGAGIGMGLGLMMPAFYSEAMKQSGQTDAMKCPDCQGPVAADSTFCPACGHQLVVFSRCPKCGKNLTPHAKFCSRCGSPAGDAPLPKKCTQCNTDNLPDSVYCNHCGNKIG